MSQTKLNQDHYIKATIASICPHLGRIHRNLFNTSVFAVKRPAHIPAGVGRWTLPLVGKINNDITSESDRVITNQLTATSQYISIRGQTSPLAEKNNN